MKQEYVKKLAELKAKPVKTPEEQTYFDVLNDLDVKERAQPFNRQEVEAAKEAVELEEEKLDKE